MFERGRTLLPSLLALLAAALPSRGQDPDASQETPEERESSREYLRSLSLEELLSVRVSTASRKEQPLVSTPAAVSVIRGDDLRRMGVTNLPDALRAIPGVNVARIDGSMWAVSIRGFNAQFATKLQVLVDGRSVYTNLFSGVYWDIQDTMIEDIDRIEVIRGPGASQWGANAVNGVINVITKKAKDTQGGLVRGGGGSEVQGFTSARYGGKAGEDLHYRVFAKYFHHDEQHQASDRWYQGRTGLRMDWTPDGENELSLIGEYYDGTGRHLRTAPTLTVPFSRTFVDREEVAGGHLVGRWERTLSEESSLRLQLNYTNARREFDVLEERSDTFSLDFDHRFPLLEGHDVVWGAGYRVTADDFENSFVLMFDPPSETHHLYSAFVQDEIALVPDEVSLLLGSKFEYNTHTHFEVQPTARLHWQAHPRHGVWAAASRAVRTPSRSNDDLRINFVVAPHPLPPPTLAFLSNFGNRAVEAEEVTSIELGYRSRPIDPLVLDAAFFWSEYDDLIAHFPGPSFTEGVPPFDREVFPAFSDNVLEGRAFGAELAATLNLSDRWRLYGAYSYLRLHLEEKDPSNSLAADEFIEGSSPRHQIFLRSSWDVLDDFEFDLMSRYVDVLPAQPADSYWELAARLAWHPTDSLELAVIGENLLHDEHEEFGNATDGTFATEQERGFYVSVSLQF